MSSELGGVFHVGSQAITWQMGSASVVMVSEAAVASLLAGREIVARLTGEAQGWTVGQQVRALLRWLGWGRESSERGRAMLAECKWHYLRSRPGKLSAACMWDLSAAYYTSLLRLPSPAVILTDRAPIFAAGTEEQEERWFRLVRGVGGHKPMRNSLVGCMAGGGNSGWAYHRGRLHQQGARRGPLHDAAALIVRTTYDLCELEAKASKAVYANTDCIIAEGGRVPAVWPEFGFDFTLDAHGPAEVIAIGSYRVGNKQTQLYRLGHRHEELVESPALAASGLTEWLQS